MQQDGQASGGPPERTVETLAAMAAMEVTRLTGGRGVQPLLDLMIAALKRRHPATFDRLAELGEAEVLIDPTDLPLCLLLRLGQTPGLRPCPRAAMASSGAGAAIHGRFAVLLELFEGRIDGDTLFFSRDLTIEGDTELVVGLRNAVDGEAIDLAADLAAAMGPPGALLNPARQLAAVIGEQLDAVRSVFLAPVNRRLEGIERRLNRLEAARLAAVKSDKSKAEHARPRNTRL